MLAKFKWCSKISHINGIWIGNIECITSSDVHIDCVWSKFLHSLIHFAKWKWKSIFLFGCRCTIFPDRWHFIVQQTFRHSQRKMFYCPHFCIQFELATGIKSTASMTMNTHRIGRRNVFSVQCLWCEVHNHNIYKPLFRWQTIQLQ